MYYNKIVSVEEFLKRKFIPFDFDQIIIFNSLRMQPFKTEDQIPIKSYLSQ